MKELLKNFNTMLLLLICLVIMLCTCGESGKQDYYLNAAKNTAEWLNSVKVETDDGTYWPVVPDTSSAGDISLYHGSPGVVLFYLELFKATGDSVYLQTAGRGATWLMHKADRNNNGYSWNINVRNRQIPETGLYTGTAGIGSVFLEMYKHTGKDEYLEYAAGAADWLCKSIIPKENGAVWGNSNDIVSGAAGIGLFLIRAAKELREQSYLITAKKAGYYLINEAIVDKHGFKWQGIKGWEKLYPNFSHGTSGIAFFLASLFKETGMQGFYESSYEGAGWLMAYKRGEKDEASWYHHEPDGKDLFYVSWCHGPGGSARLFYQLYKISGKQDMLDWVNKSATWLMNCGLDSNPLKGHWNLSVCCGSAGIGEFFADIYKTSGKKEYLLWAEKMADELISKSNAGGMGWKWVQAEHRTRPDEVYAQTGFSQGAAGIGLFFLKMYALEKKNLKYEVYSLPDNPFEW